MTPRQGHSFLEIYFLGLDMKNGSVVSYIRLK
jgi:hypothetical protein